MAFVPDRATSVAVVFVGVVLIEFGLTITRNLFEIHGVLQKIANKK